MIGNAFARMEAMLPNATKTDRMLIDKLKEMGKEAIVALTISELSEKTGVGDATLSRFCRKLNYRSFQDFKLSLSREMGGENEDVGCGGMPAVKCERMRDAIDETYRHTDYAKHLEIAREIVKAHRVCVFGYSNSSIAATALRYRLMREGVVADGATDTYMRHLSVANLNARDVVILISISGSTQDVVTLAESVKKSGAKIVAITDNSRSALASYADYILLSSRKEGAHYAGSLATVVAQIYVADVLCAAVAEVLSAKPSKIK